MPFTAAMLDGVFWSTERRPLGWAGIAPVAAHLALGLVALWVIRLAVRAYSTIKPVR